MKKFIQRVWGAIISLYEKLTNKAKFYVPVAINVVEAIKSVMDSPVDDIVAEIVKRVIPGIKDDIIIDKAREVIQKWVPKILLELKLVDSIANIEDPNERLKAILSQLNISSDEAKNIIYHGLASLILEKLSDGELSWSDSVAISEYYYKNIVKK